MFIKSLAAVLFLTGAVFALPAAADLAATVDFNIAPQPLSAALLKFSAQSRIQVTSPSELVESHVSAGVVGALAAREALARLLQGTELSYDVIDGNTVAIRRAGAARVGAAADRSSISMNGNAAGQPVDGGTDRLRL